MKGIATVFTIQVGGYKNCHTLKEACEEYLRMITNTEGYRDKISFAIHCNDGVTRFITIRDEDDKTVAYGDFKGIPDILEYAKILSKK